jgi:hypothetical protein
MRHKTVSSNKALLAVFKNISTTPCKIFSADGNIIAKNAPQTQGNI